MKHILGALAAALILANASTAFAQEVRLRYSSWLPDQHHVNQNAMYPWFKEIESVTEGRVTVEILPKVVGTAASQFDVVRDGLADVSFIVSGYTPGRFPLAEMAELSFLGDDQRIFAPIFNTLYNEHFKQFGEYDGVELMTVFSNSPGNIMTTRKPIGSVADMRGVKLRSSGPYTTALLEAVGAIPILNSSNEAFEMLSTGVIDGSLAQRETVQNMNLLDMVGHYTIIPGGLFSAGLAVIINPDRWQQISEADRAAIMAVSQEKLAAAMGKSFYDADMASEAAMRERPATSITVASPEFVAELREVVKPLEEEWAGRARAKGVEDPLAVLEALRTAVAAAEASKK